MAVAAAVKASGATEDDEAWLYGDSENGENKEPIAPGIGPEEQLPSPKEDTAVREETQQDVAVPKYNNEDGDSDDDEDDVQVTIGDIKAFPVTSAGGSLFIGGGTYQKQPVVSGAVLKGAITTHAKGIDVDGEGVMNGIQLYEYTLDMLRDEDKPWRQPGADITDYFNYGFNEDTWRKYCHKQTRLRQESGAPMTKFGSLGMLIPKLEPSDHMSLGMNRTQNPMSRSVQASPGTIAVLGSTTASRRPVEESIDDVQLLGSLDDLSKPQMNLPPPGLPTSMGIPPPNYSMPPPGIPQMPPFSHAFPPGMPVPPPGMYAQPPPIPTFYPPHMTHPDLRSFAERPLYGYDNQSLTITSYSDPQSSYPRSDSHRERDRYEYKRDKSPGVPGNSSDTSDDYRYARTKEYSKDYERGQERSPRSRERSKSKSRERDRRYRDRERDEKRDDKRDDKRDEKKPKRKFKAEPDSSEYYKSSSSLAKHKTSKKSKRDKDGNSSDRGGVESDGT